MCGYVCVTAVSHLHFSLKCYPWITAFMYCQCTISFYGKSQDVIDPDNIILALVLGKQQYLGNK